MKYTLPAFGSILEITLKNSKNDSGISESFGVIENFEKKYSRFQSGNILSKINSQKSGILEPEIVSLITLCQKVSKITDGCFDITLLPLLENAGYGIASAKLAEDFGYKNIILEKNKLTLKNDITIEFGSCGKGYMLDHITNILQKYHSECTVNFGGDMRVTGTQKVLLEDPLNTEKHVGELTLTNLSLASSAGNRRKFGDQHHLINVKNQSSQDDKLAIYVTHKLGVFADIFATALFVTPLKKSLEILEKIEGLEALIISKDGKMYKTSGFNCKLSI